MIQPEEYKSIADELGGARGDAEKAFKLFQNMKTHLRDSVVDVDDIDKLTLRNNIELAYFIVVDRYHQPHTELKLFVTALQGHILRIHGDVNDYLKTNEIQVSQDFADISSVVGFSIDLENIL